MVTRKLHFSYLPKSARIRVQVCELRDVKRESKLLSSTDAPIAIEVHRPADKVQRRAWVAIGEHHFQSVIVMPWDARECVALAVQIYNALGAPDVGAIVFTRDLMLTRLPGGSSWQLDVPVADPDLLAEPPVALD